MVKKRIVLCVLAAVCLLLSAFPAVAQGKKKAELFVSSAGSDAAEGTLEAPLATLEGAKAYLKTHKNDFPDGATVYLRAGTYYFDKECVFDGTDLGNVTYRAYENEEVVFSGAKALTGFTETTVNGVKAFSLQTDLRFNTLYHPAKEIDTPRWPETGNFTVKDVDHADDLFDEKTTYWEASRGNTSFNADPQQVGIAFSQPEAVYCRITHAWLDEIARIRFYDETTGKVGLGRPATYQISSGDVYWFENVKEALDSPGEWYLDEAASTLYYIPFAGEAADSLTLFAPATAFLMRIDGCSGLGFEGIRFAYTEWTLAVPPEDNEVRYKYNIDAYQASTESEAAINILNADRISFTNCEFIDIGNTAVKYVKNAHDCAVSRCIFRRIGSTAIAVYGENVAPDAENAAEAMGGFTIENNLVEAYGRNTYESTGVHLMYVCDSVVTHNEIHDGYYTGLSCGWIWGHEYQVTKNVRITNNLIYDIGQGWLSDLGGMYLLGEQKGTVISGNVIYNVTRGLGANDYGGNGIYTDAGSSYFTIEQNLIYDCAANGLNLGGYNRQHTVKNNIVAFCKLACFDPGWGDGEPDDCTCTATGNIFYADNAPVILDLTKKATYKESGNLLWDKTNGEAVFGSTGYSGNYEKKSKVSVFFAKRNGYLKDDVIADPLFADPENRDFTLREGSPALDGKIGFVPFDPSQAGIEKDVTPGCGSPYTPGTHMRVSDLSAYPNACSDEAVPYALVALGEPAMLALTLACLAAAAVLNLLTFRRKRFPAAKNVPLAVCAPVMAALVYPMYLVFCVKWTAPLYGVCLALFMVAAAVTPWLAFKKLPVKLILILAATAASFGATFALNNLLHLGEALALFAGTALPSLLTLASATILYKTLKKPAQTDG